jgi:predicted NBD/HSP70 family sugar kinase
MVKRLEFTIPPQSLLRQSDTAAVLSVVAQLIATAQATTKPSLGLATGLSRSAIDQAVHRLSSMGLIGVTGMSTNVGRGRPAEVLGLRPDAGTVLIADLTPNHVHTAVVDLSRRLLASKRTRFALANGPEPTMTAMFAQFQEMLGPLGRYGLPIRAIVVSVPGPVDAKRGVPVRPPIMPGWDEFPLTERVADEFGAPCYADNDVNLMATGEARSLPGDQCPLLFIKVGTGIGGGLVGAPGEQPARGADGAAYDIGHIPAPGLHQEVCTCGNVGCIEAVASAEAITVKLRNVLGNQELTRPETERLVHDGDPQAVRVVREAAALLGEVAATLVHVLNPARIALGGPITRSSDDLLAGIRSVVYQRALPLATRNLTIAHSVTGELSVVVGAAAFGIEKILSRDAFSTKSGRF